VYAEFRLSRRSFRFTPGRGVTSTPVLCHIDVAARHHCPKLERWTFEELLGRRRAVMLRGSSRCEG
jgi:hypothetical protein